MTEYKSEVKTIYAPQERVYERLANLNNLSVIQQNLDNPELRDRLLSQAGDKVSPSQVDSIIGQLRNLRFDADSVSGSTMVGEITLRIIEREPCKTIKFQLEGAPMQANMWIQLLSADEERCAMRLTLHADLNFFIRQMVGSKLQQGVDGLATMLASLPY